LKTCVAALRLTAGSGQYVADILGEMPKHKAVSKQENCFSSAKKNLH